MLAVSGCDGQTDDIESLTDFTELFSHFFDGFIGHILAHFLQKQGDITTVVILQVAGLFLHSFADNNLQFVCHTFSILLTSSPNFLDILEYKLGDLLEPAISSTPILHSLLVLLTDHQRILNSLNHV